MLHTFFLDSLFLCPLNFFKQSLFTLFLKLLLEVFILLFFDLNFFRWDVSHFDLCVLKIYY